MAANGDMLRVARHRRGFQQTEAAKRLGVDQSLLSRFENGLVEPRDDVVMKASRVYEMPASFFYQRDPIYGAPVSVHPMWRRKADVSGRELDGVVAELNIRVMHLRRLNEGAEIAHTSNLPRLDMEEYGDAEKIAGLVRAHWKVPSGPLRNLTLLVEKAGIIVGHSNLGGASISGVTFAAPGVSRIVILNSDQPADRQRFTLAHEIAHLVMHRFPRPDMEREANEFAVALLMPAVDIRPYFVGRRVELSMLASLKPEWRVSMAALLMRAHKLGYIQDGQYTYLWKQMSARKYRLREPPELDFAPEVPTVLGNVLRVHVEALGYSVSDLAKFLHMHEGDLIELYPMLASGEPRKAKLTVIK